MLRPTRRFLLLVCIALLAPIAAQADVALDWLSTSEEATAKLGGRTDRARAIAWLSAFNALDAIDPRYQPYAPAPAPVPSAGLRPSTDAALAAAIYTALVVEPDADQALLVRRYRETLASVKSAPEREAGAILGQQAALMLLAARSADRLGRVEPPTREAAAGVFVAPGYAKMPRSIVITRLTPFGVRSVDAFDPGPPPALGSDVAAREIAETRSLGSIMSTARSGDQSGAAVFWNSGDPSDFSSMLKTLLEPRKLEPLDVARMLALDAMISVDDNIVNTTFKERYAHWRPESAIAGPFAAAADRDPDWQSLVRVPNSPQYPSGGGNFAGVFEVEMPRLFGVAGPIEWRNSQTGQARRWPSAAQAADEIASSRIWAGVHFRSAVDAGRRVGRQIATEILDRQLLAR